MQTSGAIALSGMGVGGNIYNEWSSWDGTATVAEYACLDTDVLYSYSWAGYPSTKSVTANMNLQAKGGAAANRFLVGGFAYNANDYAATYVRGSLANAPVVSTLTYKNSLSASSTKVSASETFSGAHLQELIAETWAERGNMVNEVKSQGTFPATPGDVTVAGMWLDVLTGNTAGAGLFQRPYGDQAGWQLNNVLYSGQWMNTQGVGGITGDVTISSSKPYTASASLTSNVASSSQSAAFTVATGTVDAQFDSFAASGDIMSGNDAEANVFSTGDTGTVTYSASSKATTTQSTATQTMSIPKAGFTAKNGVANSWLDVLTAAGNVNVANAGAGTFASMAGSDTATAKAGSSSVTQKLTSSLAANIGRADAADDFGGNYGTSTALTITPVATLASQLSGQSIITATTKGTSILSTGPWRATVAAGSTFFRANDAGPGPTAGGFRMIINENKVPATRTIYSFSDKPKATAITATAAL